MEQLEQEEEQPSRLELLAWMEQPVGQWLFQALQQRFRPQEAWRQAETWEYLNRLKGQADVLEWIEDQVKAG